MNLSDRFFSHVEKTNGCWLWLAVKSRRGYGRIFLNGRTVAAHRVSLLLAGRSVPSDRVVDHVCRNRACVNPDHLRMVTPRQSSLENNHGPVARNAQKTHCKRGHSLTGANLVERKKPRRVCRICSLAQDREAKRKIYQKRGLS